MNYAVGIDMGGTAVKIGLFTSEGILLDRTEFPTNASLGKDRVFDSIAEEVRGKLKAQKTCLINLMSSPGSGKTATLLALRKYFSGKLKWGVIPSVD